MEVWKTKTWVLETGKHSSFSSADNLLYLQMWSKRTHLNLAPANNVVLVLFFPITEKKEEVKDESEESDDDMGFGKFTFIFNASMISWINFMAQYYGYPSIVSCMTCVFYPFISSKRSPFIKNLLLKDGGTGWTFKTMYAWALWEEKINHSFGGPYFDFGHPCVLGLFSQSLFFFELHCATMVFRIVWTAL